MPTIRELNRLAMPALTPVQERLQAAAMEYVMHGWGVVPGSACDGLTYTKGHTREKVANLEPALRSARTVRDVRAARSWWALAPYGILARAGESFDVIEAPTWLAVSANGRPEFRQRLCPVTIAPPGVRILVQLGASLWPELSAARGVQIAAAGTVVPLPPTRMLGGLTAWWIRPAQVNWQLGDADAVQDALCVVLEESRARGANGFGGEAHA